MSNMSEQDKLILTDDRIKRELKRKDINNV